jgi:hypothetical protein
MFLEKLNPKKESNLLSVNAKIEANLKLKTDKILKKRKGTWVSLVTLACEQLLREELANEKKKKP